MPRPEGIWVGRHSFIGNIDLKSILPGIELPTLDVPAEHSPPKFRIPDLRHSRGHRGLPVFDHGAERRICKTCPAPCCMVLMAGLTEEEVRSGHYAMDGPDDNNNYYLARSYGRCHYLTGENMCSIYDRRPAVCRDYRCDNPGSEDHRINKWFLRHL